MERANQISVQVETALNTRIRVTRGLGVDLSRIVETGRKWSKVVKTGRKWSKLVQTSNDLPCS